MAGKACRKSSRPRSARSGTRRTVSFGLCPLLTQGAIHAIEAGGSEELKANYLPKMVAGRLDRHDEFDGAARRVPTSRTADDARRAQGDGTYRITGTKIFITYGEHDMAENIIHLVLARLPNAPAGTRGISLFLVPKFLVNDDGSLGERNDVVCAGIEHKLGIMASPTCVMKFGEKGGAIGYLVGQENRGLATMFVMMNAARLGGRRSGCRRRRARHAACGRLCEGATPGQKRRGKRLSRHEPDHRACRCPAHAADDEGVDAGGPHDLLCYGARARYRASRTATRMRERPRCNKAALLTPLAKAFSTDIANEVASLGVQVHGGMGFVEETGAAQYLATRASCRSTKARTASRRSTS